MSLESYQKKAKAYASLGLPWWATSKDIDVALQKSLYETEDRSEKAALMAAREELSDPETRNEVDLLAYRVPLDKQSINGNEQYCFPRLPVLSPELILNIPGQDTVSKPPLPVKAFNELKGKVEQPFDGEGFNREIGSWILDLLDRLAWAE